MTRKKLNKHKYSTILLIFLLTLLIIRSIVSVDSEEIDEVCDTNNTILYRYNGTWTCGVPADLNITGSNVTNTDCYKLVHGGKICESEE